LFVPRSNPTTDAQENRNMTQIESSRSARATHAAAEVVAKEVLPKKVESKQAKIEKAASHGTTQFVKAKKTERALNKQGGPVIKAEKNRSGRKAKIEAKKPAAPQAPKTSQAAKQDAFDQFKDVVDKLTEGAKLTVGLINEFKNVGLAIKDFISALKGEAKPAPAPPSAPAPEAPAPEAPSGSAPKPEAPAPEAPAPEAPAPEAPAPEAPSGSAPKPEAPAPPSGAPEPDPSSVPDLDALVKEMSKAYDKMFSDFDAFLKQLQGEIAPLQLPGKEEAKAWSGVSSGIGFPLTIKGNIADPEAFKLWTAGL
jgi:hypothetical protein